MGHTEYRLERWSRRHAAEYCGDGILQPPTVQTGTTTGRCAISTTREKTGFQGLNIGVEETKARQGSEAVGRLAAHGYLSRREKDRRAKLCHGARGYATQASNKCCHRDWFS